MHKRQRGKPVTAASQSQRLQQQVQATTTSMLGSSPGGGGEVRRGCKEKKKTGACAVVRTASLQRQPRKQAGQGLAAGGRRASPGSKAKMSSGQVGAQHESYRAQAARAQGWPLARASFFLPLFQFLPPLLRPGARGLAWSGAPRRGWCWWQWVHSCSRESGQGYGASSSQ